MKSDFFSPPISMTSTISCGATTVSEVISVSPAMPARIDQGSTGC